MIVSFVSLSKPYINVGSSSCETDKPVAILSSSPLEEGVIA